MKNLNLFVLEGRLVQDAKKRQINEGLSAYDFAIAVNSTKKNKASGEYEDRASFFTMSLMGEYGEKMGPHLTKGKLIAVVGELRQDRWEKNGGKFQRIAFLPKEINFIASPKGKGTDGTETGKDMPQEEAFENEGVAGDDYEDSFAVSDSEAIF